MTSFFQSKAKPEPVKPVEPAPPPPSRSAEEISAAAEAQRRRFRGARRPNSFTGGSGVSPSEQQTFATKLLGG